MMMSFWVEAPSISSNPLFSTVVTLYTLILLYLPAHFTAIAFSPVLILTAALLLSLLRLGVSQASESPPPSSTADENDAVTCPNDDDQTEEDHDREWSDTDSEPESGSDSSPSFESSFVPWNLRAPLGVIYEEEEEEEEDGDESLGFEKNRFLSRYFAESDSDISSDGDLSAMGFCDSPENLMFEWDEEDRDEELIEIAFNNNNNNNNNNEKKKKMKILDFHVDEDSFIEIDISNQVRFNL